MVSFSYPRVGQATLAADILALVISAQPTEAKPLKVSLTMEESGLAYYPAFRSAGGWSETIIEKPSQRSYVLECEFVWNAAARKLANGSIPLVALAGSGWIVPVSSREPAADDSAKQMADTIKLRIKTGIHDGTMSAEKNLPPNSMPQSGLQRQIVLAGYYDALAAFCNEWQSIDTPLVDPFKSKDSEMTQLHRAGWNCGMNRARAIAIQARRDSGELKGK